MGLDIKYFERLELVDHQQDDDDSLVRLLNESCFAAQGAGLQPASVPIYNRMVWYGRHQSAGATGWFRAGSYGGYNEWRKWLCSLALGVDVDEVWKNPAAYAGKPFVELINFSDCEGTIGPVVSAKLAKDFAEFSARAAGANADGYGSLYRDFAKAFETAAKGGAVKFC